MRRVLIGASVTAGLALVSGAYAAPQPEKSLLGVRIMDTWKTVLAKFGQPTRIEAGPPLELTPTPTTSVGGMGALGPLSFGGPAGIGTGMAGAPGTPMVGGLSGPPSAPMMGGIGMAGGGGAPRTPMAGGIGMIGAPRGAMGGISSGGAPIGMSGPPPGAMGGMSSGGGIGVPGRGGSSMMVSGPPMGAMSPMSSGGPGLPGLGGMGMMSRAPGGAGMTMPGLRGGLTAPGMAGGMSTGMMGAPMLGGMPGASMPGGMTGMGATSAGTYIETGAGEVAWVYEKGTNTTIFLFNNEGRLIQIQAFGYKAGARTVNGVGLGDPASRVYAIYGFPDETVVSGNSRTLDYSKKANVAFQLADRGDGKGMRVVGITVALTKAPNPEQPE